MSKHQKRAGFIFAVALVTLSNSVSAASLNQEQLLSQLVGKKLHAKTMGMSVQLVYKNNGTITMKMPIMSGKGTWWLKGNQICMDMKSGPRRGLTCVTFEHIKGKRFRNSQGVDFIVQE
ncbi:hypothetical protein MNBD_ALPHA08-2337 [hydrothermal vent metagenome]|uniref:Uncharacterized protein n=1 Tax=hydrothermal vent metagenome TaxID=652676 RepID=A0A3B0RS77_9ZZZZ